MARSVANSGGAASSFPGRVLRERCENDRGIDNRDKPSRERRRLERQTGGVVFLPRAPGGPKCAQQIFEARERRARLCAKGPRHGVLVSPCTHPVRLRVAPTDLRKPVHLGRSRKIGREGRRRVSRVDWVFRRVRVLRRRPPVPAAPDGASSAGSGAQPAVIQTANGNGVARLARARAARTKNDRFLDCAMSVSMIPPAALFDHIFAGRIATPSISVKVPITVAYWIAPSIDRALRVSAIPGPFSRCAISTPC